MSSAWNDDLCDSCIELDFEEIFAKVDIPKTGIEITTINEYRRPNEEPDCRLCRFFHQAKTTYGEHYSQHVRLFPRKKEFGCIVASEIACKPFLSVLCTNTNLDYTFDSRNQIVQQGVISYIADDNTTSSEIHEVGPNVLYQAIRQRLEHCSRKHLSCENGTVAASGLPYIVLIDCIHEKIVKRTLEDEYMTLSYVRGSKLAQNWSLDAAPLTVRDAMHVVRSLSKRYLWVDRYCIDQDNAEETALMLQHMDVIYEKSIATIVALSGSDDEAGLPGVSSTLRKLRQSFKTAKGSLMWSYPSISMILASSKWNTRGWTYQEARLSRRCVCFSVYQVYCVCRETTWSESLPLEALSSNLTMALNRLQLDGRLFSCDVGIQRGLLADRSQYTKRALTYEQDALIAFQGILLRSSFITFWGVPVTLQNSSMDMTIGFALGLAWRKTPLWSIDILFFNWNNKDCIRRRPGFPTWSWTSLEAEIYHEQVASRLSVYDQYLDGLPVNFPHNEAGIKFWLLSNGNETPLADLVISNGSIVPTDPNQELLIEGDLVRIRYVIRVAGTDHRRYELDDGWKVLVADDAPSTSYKPPTVSQCRA